MLQRMYERDSCSEKTGQTGRNTKTLVELWGLALCHVPVFARTDTRGRDVWWRRNLNIEQIIECVALYQKLFNCKKKSNKVCLSHASSCIENSMWSECYWTNPQLSSLWPQEALLSPWHKAGDNLTLRNFPHFFYVLYRTSLTNLFRTIISPVLHPLDFMASLSCYLIKKVLRASCYWPLGWFMLFCVSVLQPSPSVWWISSINEQKCVLYIDFFFKSETSLILDLMYLNCKFNFTY